MNFGERLADLRNEKNLTRKELAKVLNIAYTTLSGYESNYRFPDQDMLLKISDFFDVSVDYLLGKVDINRFRVPDPAITEYYSKEYKELSLYFAKNEADDTKKGQLFSGHIFSNSLLNRVYELSEESKRSLREYLGLLELRDMQRRNQANNDSKTSE